jgi:hypothetical protein
MMKNKLEKLFDRLRQEGWYCGWAESCCQTCAWADLPFEHEIGPFKGEDVDFSKCLFNHEQDCENEEWCVDASDDEFDNYVYDGEGTVETYSSDEMSNSSFCFGGDKKGVKNLKEILPIIEEMGCTYRWNQKGDQRISIDWGDE